VKPLFAATLFTMSSLRTQDVLQYVCTSLNHKDAVSPLVKKLVAEHLLAKVDDYRQVPQERLERWGVPLKLIAEVAEALENDQATSNVAGINAWINYTARPWLHGSAAFRMARHLSDGVQRRQDPQEWAAMRLQGAWRCRKRRRQKLQDEVLEAFDPEDFTVPSEQEKLLIRTQRAEERIRRMVRRWKYRKAEQGASLSPAADSADAPPSAAAAATAAVDAAAAAEQILPTGNDAELVSGFHLAKHLAVASSRRLQPGELPECETTELILKLAQDMGRQKEDMAAHVHRLVTLNWLEDVEDLRLVEDHHWTEWDMPERMVIAIKGELAQRRETGLSSGLSNFGANATDFVYRIFGFA